MLNFLRPALIGRWLLALALAGGYVCCGGCWHHDHDYDHHDDHRDWHDDHDHYHDHDHY